MLIRYNSNHPSPLPQVCLDGLVGRAAADRDRGHDKKNTLPEARKCYSAQCLEMCSAVVAVSQIDTMLAPIKKVCAFSEQIKSSFTSIDETRSTSQFVDLIFWDSTTYYLQVVLETTRSKTRTKLEDLLRCLVTGFLRNPLFSPTVSMVFCRELLTESLQTERKQRQPEQQIDKKPDIFELPAAPKRDGIKPKVQRASTVHALHQFSLQMLCTLLKRGTVSVQEHAALLDPFAEPLCECLNSPDVRTQVLAVRSCAHLFEQPVLLPSLCERVPALTTFSFSILRNHSRSTNSGSMLELIFCSFRILTVILREHKDFSLSELQVKTLLQYIADDIHNRNRQASAFSLLRALLSRDIVLQEIPELLERVFELSIVGQVRCNGGV